MRTRLAPTPSGYLHIGNAVSFVLTWALARSREGWVLLRIDDLDARRRRPEYLADIFQTIEWLGIDYDEGPQGPDEFLQSYSQQLRLPLYREALTNIKDQGHLYACTCSRKEIRLRSPDGRYPGTCLPLGKDFQAPGTAWRVKVPDQQNVDWREWQKGRKEFALGQDMGDFVVRQKNGSPAYQIASVVDDEFWKIDFIVRGEDLRSSTAAQQYLAGLLGYTTFQEATFWHHGLITGMDGQKLSKSAGADALKSWREAGRGPEEIYMLAAEWMGLQSGPITNAQELVAEIR